MSWSLVCKVFQRRSFDILSHKNGVILILISLTLLAFGGLYFGRVLILWLSGNYYCSSSIFPDNIGGRSYEDYLRSRLPIDVVYTWVNGSDPVLIRHLNEIKRDMVRFLQNASHNSQANYKCTLDNCILANGFVIVPAMNVTDTLENLFNSLDVKAQIFQISVETIKATCVLFLNKEDLNQAMALNITMFNRSISMKRLYYTSDGLNKNSHKIEGLILSLGLPGDSEPNRLLAKFGDNFISDFSVDVSTGITSFYVHNETIRNQIFSEKSFTISGKSVTFLQGFLVWDLEPATDVISEISSNRFRDTDELRFSLRSLEQFLPWVRHVFVVTNGQVPSWLDLSNPRLTVIIHEEIFSNLSHLPTFSSPAIETHLHKIPGLSDRFIYLNDDVFFGRPVWPEDFILEDGSHKIYLTYSVPDCKSGCPGSWIRDGYCDRACNCSECEWDGGDCDPNSTTLARKQFNIFSNQQGQFPWSNSHHAQYCNPGCADNWIADRYCDTSCNVYNCGFDAGDCGMGDFDKIQQVPLQKDQSEYSYLGYTVLHFELSAIIGSNGFVVSGEFDDNLGIRSFSYVNSSKLLTLVLKTNFSKSLIGVSIDLKEGHSANFVFNFTVEVDTTIEEKLVNGSQMRMSKAAEDLQPKRKWQNISHPFPQPKKQPPLQLDTSLDLHNFRFPENVLKELNGVLSKFQSKLLTRKGLMTGQRNVLREHFGRNNLTWSESLMRNFLKKSLTKDPGNRFDSGIFDPLKKALYRKSIKIKKQTNHDIFPEIKEDINMENSSFGFFPWEKREVFDKAQKEMDKIRDTYTTEPRMGRHLMDAFADSIRHVNRIYNKAYGFFARKVPAHSAHFFDKRILTDMHSKFATEFEQTSSHKIRSGQDMQLAFSYYYFLLSEFENRTMEQIFDDFDIDGSEVLSDRELRVLATRLYPLPLFLKELVDLESMLINCSSEFQSDTEPRLNAERYYERRLPQVTLDFISNCSPVRNVLVNSFSSQQKYKHIVVPNADDFVTFKMIRGNASVVMRQLDEIRKSLKKFICLNDDLDDASDAVAAEHVRSIINDFYVTFFPKPSQFELIRNHENTFLDISELRRWKGWSIYSYIILGVALLCVVYRRRRSLVFKIIFKR